MVSTCWTGAGMLSNYLRSACVELQRALVAFIFFVFQSLYFQFMWKQFSVCHQTSEQLWGINDGELFFLCCFFQTPAEETWSPTTNALIILKCQFLTFCIHLWEAAQNLNKTDAVFVCFGCFCHVKNELMMKCPVYTNCVLFRGSVTLQVNGWVCCLMDLK